MKSADNSMPRLEPCDTPGKERKERSVYHQIYFEKWKAGQCYNCQKTVEKSYYLVSYNRQGLRIIGRGNMHFLSKIQVDLENKLREWNKLRPDTMLPSR